MYSFICDLKTHIFLRFQIAIYKNALSNDTLVSYWVGGFLTLNERIFKVFMGIESYIDSLLGETRLYK
jgi:hypothetical protein